MNNLEWMKNLPPELMQFIEQLLPLPSVVIKYQQEIRRLEMEVLVLGNIILEKGLITKEELDEMTKKIMESKKEQYENEDDELVRKLTKEQQDIVVDEIQNIVDFKAEHKALLEKEREVVKKSARMAPKGHNIK